MGEAGTDSGKESGSFLGPLVISLVCMIGTCLAIVAYHFFVIKYCLRRRLVAQEIIARRNREAAYPGNQTGLGVEGKVLNTIPIFTYNSSAQKGHLGNFRVDHKECAVCLGELEDGEAVRLLPGCRHVFHVPCIDQWFLTGSNCPVCRSAIVAPAVEEELPLDKLPPPAPGSGGSLTPERLSRVGLLRHCVSFVVMTEAPGLMPRGDAGLQRSFSMVDPSHLVIDIEREQLMSTTSFSSSPSSSSSTSSREGEALLIRSDSIRNKTIPSGVTSAAPIFLATVDPTGCSRNSSNRGLS